MPSKQALVPVGTIGAGTMGAGIAQVAATAGHQVLIYDVAEGAATAAKERIIAILKRQVEKGRMSAEDCAASCDRLGVANTLEELSTCGLVVEAIVENADIKIDLFRKLEEIVPQDAILATNTSSISVTAIGAGLRNPWRFVGMHFFNPAPLMKLVEVVRGLATSDDVVAEVAQLAVSWGKKPVEAVSSPGFVVNRIARPFYGEGLRIREEGFADFATIDAVMTEGAGFRMGPFTLMDLIGNDVNFSVSQSVFEAYFGDPRFRPSLLQQEYVRAGWLGRKSGRGYYDYAEGAKPETAATLERADIDPFPFDLAGNPTKCGETLVALTDGRTAKQRALDEGAPVVLYDLTVANAKRISVTRSNGVPESDFDAIVASLQSKGFAVSLIGDCPGLIAMRTVAMLANEAFDAVLQGVTTAEGADEAMRFGVNYPKGPITWAQDIGLHHVATTLKHLEAAYGDPRYRVSLALAQAALS